MVRLSQIAVMYEINTVIYIYQPSSVFNPEKVTWSYNKDETEFLFDNFNLEIFQTWRLAFVITALLIGCSKIYEKKDHLTKHSIQSKEKVS